MSRKITESELKILFAKSHNQCAFPDCNTKIILKEGDEEKPIAEMAHMIAYHENGPRVDSSIPKDELNKANNLILLCPTHHTTIDKFPMQYSIEVLREMKTKHENSYDEEEQDNKDFIEEILYFSFLPITKLPEYVFSAPTKYRKNNILELFDAIDAKNHSEVIYSFELKDRRIYTFYNLSETENPFRGAYNTKLVKVQKVSELLKNPDSRRLYISLLNRALKSFLKKQGVGYDREHYRFFFQPDRKTMTRTYSYKSLSGKTTNRNIVWNPITKKSSLPKKFWIHLASNISFQQVASNQWVLTIRPERHLTKDGYELYNTRYVGRKITKMKSTLYNWQYLQEIHFWREFLTNASPRLIMNFDGQSIIIENKLSEDKILWPGIEEDDRAFVSKEHEDDLFSLADYYAAIDEETHIDNNEFIYEEENPT